MTCVPNLTFACVMHTLLVNMCAYYQEEFLTLIYCSKQFCGMIMENVENARSRILTPFLINCYDVHIKTMFGSNFPPVVCRRAYVLFTLFVFVCV